MKRLLTLLCLTLLAFTVVSAGECNFEILLEATSDEDSLLREWVFTGTPAGDFANDDNWKTDSKSRYCYTKAMNDEIAMANGKAVEMTQTLRFTIPANSAGNLRFGGSTNSMWLGDQCSFTIPTCRKGDFVKVEYMTSNKSANRTPTATNLVGELLSTTGNTHVTAFVEIADDGDVTISVPGGLYFYNLKVGPKDAIEKEGDSGDDSGTHVSPDNPDNPKDTEHAFDITRDFSKLHEEMFGNGPKIYVSPTGDDKNDGLTPETPIKDIQLAVDKALDPGTTIILAPGEYRPTERININDRNGTHDNYNAMVCLDGRAVINCNHPYHKHSDNPYQGVRLTSSYWYFYHVDITNASDNGMLIERNKPTGGTSADIVAATHQAHDNVIDACNFYKNGDTGLQMKNLASYNYIINCDAYLNCDEDQGDADGFAPKISVGTGNYFFGCRAYLNSDDGWDVFYKKDGNFGDNMTIILDNCITYKNGFLDENTIASSGNGNGFKCGSDQGAMNVYMNRCLAVLNKAKGFDQNHNSGDIILNNCTGLTSKSICGDKAYSYRIYETISSDHKVELNNCIAINDNDEKDKRDSSGATKVNEHGKQGDYGRFEIDETLASLTVNNCEFQKAHPTLFSSLDHTQLILPRINDQLPEIQFAHINPTAVNTYTTTAKQSATVRATDLINTGTLVNSTNYRELPVLPISFFGTSPDLGAYETIAPTTIVTTENKKLKTENLYNINGQRVNSSYRGFIVTNGKKILK